MTSQQPDLKQLASSLRQAAVIEAQRRASTLPSTSSSSPTSPTSQSPQPSSRPIPDQTSAPTSKTPASTPIPPADPYQSDLAQLYEDQRLRNDFDWESLQKDVEALSGSQGVVPGLSEKGPEKSREIKEIELAQVEFQIAELQKELSKTEDLKDSLTIELKLRSETVRTIGQYDIALESLEKQWLEEEESLKMESQFLSDLKVVDEGLSKTRSDLQDKLERESEMDSIALNKLKSKLRMTEKDLGDKLQALIQTSNGLFSQAKSRMQLRSLLDNLMNQAWDRPLDPYISVERYPENLVALLVRSNVALLHPRDSRRVKLVPFHRETRSSLA
ncbi:hypothetical protein IE53DRAFT_388820 [Violaceomyces palustris]|uniref:Uncharacterized protein n=1 Tax=Violaceomyces palustris TaxID=1673888 RepID=A0ACD0NT88_9BASI|nr:hypothetical protein IE53DRAFT_388820 [Violaceomyces palustris]